MCNNEEIFLVKPTTYMNRSGFAVREMTEMFGIDIYDTVIISDDYNLQVGQLRLRETGSAGGHNGLKSVINILGTDEIPRLRIGIGNDFDGESSDYVLSKFENNDVLEELKDSGVNAVETIINLGITMSMNEINQRRIDE